MVDARLATLEADYIEAQVRLVNALTALRLAQETHAKLFGPDAYQDAVLQLARALGPQPLDEA